MISKNLWNDLFIICTFCALLLLAWIDGRGRKEPVFFKHFFIRKVFDFKVFINISK